jgi:uncharacterized protein (TIGR02588 family)
LSDKRSASARAARSSAEWVAFGIASAVLLFIVGSVAWVWVSDEGRPATLRVEREDPARRAGDQFYVTATVINSGDRTAEGVQVIAELTRGSEVVEEADQTIDFLAGGDSEQVVFVFSEDPASGELTVRASSHVKP